MAQPDPGLVDFSEWQGRQMYVPEQMKQELAGSSGSQDRGSLEGKLKTEALTHGNGAVDDVVLMCQQSENLCLTPVQREQQIWKELLLCL